MTHSLISAALFCLLSFALTLPTIANNKPDDYLRAHNSARAAVGVGPLIWDEDLAAYAEKRANRRIESCNAVRYTGRYGGNIPWVGGELRGVGDVSLCLGDGRRYGENEAWSSGELAGAEAVKRWAGEKGYYDYGSNVCSDNDKCLNYTQVVWRKSVRVGCARARCSNGGTWVVCNYDPPGNNFGQRPY